MAYSDVAFPFVPKLVNKVNDRRATTEEGGQMEQVLDHKAVERPPARITRKRIRLAILVFILAGLLITDLILHWRNNEGRFCKLRGGMTAQEVVAILGEPSGSLPASFNNEDAYGRGGRSVWRFHDGTVNVDWTRDGTVMAASWTPPPDTHERNRSPIEIIRDFLRRIGI